MTEAGGTTTCAPVFNGGPLQLWEIRNCDVSDGETITMPSASPFWTSDRIYIVGAENETSGAQLSGSSLSVDYSPTNLQFTFHEGAAADDSVAILFYRIGARKE